MSHAKSIISRVCRNRLLLQKNTYLWVFYKKNMYKKTIEKDTEITIDNMIFKFFNKKVISSKKSIFRLIMTSNIFHLKIIFYIGKMVSKKFWRSKKSFPSNMRAWSSWPPPLSCCWENVKKCQNFTYGYFVKNSKNTIINRETVFTKIFEKTRTYGDFDENFSKFAGGLGVKRPANVWTFPHW